MKVYKFFSLLVLIPTILFGQETIFKERIIKSGKYSYKIVDGDPLQTRIYQLKNGLTVYLSVYKDAPRVQTYIAVRAGSKNDPASATGLAHYLEHILFKGTTKIGSNNWKNEKIEIDKIESLYETYRVTKDSMLRARLYHQIDSISLVASGYAIPNEYDKMLSSIGASGTNAYTFLEQTVYVNEIPSNQIEKWSAIEAERFSTVVPRLFHTELEAVYEEKNKGLDNDSRKVYEELMATIFQKHTYGTQTTIGTVEHLQNPSITEIKKYFNTYYVPNNIALCLSGDLDPEKTIATIDNYFGNWKPKPLPTYTPAIEEEIKQPILKKVLGPDAEQLTIGFRLPGNQSKASLLAEMMSMVLTNGQAGLIDLNLNQQQKVLSASSYCMRFNDYSVFVLSGKPKQGQSLGELKNLLLSQIDLIKQGGFEDWLLKAIVNDYKIYKMRERESNKARADLMVDAFIARRNWKDVIGEVDQMSKFTKAEIVDFANQFFKDNYVELHKLIGSDSSIIKVAKPPITPITINREQQSEFFTQLNKKNSPTISPVFIDYNKDLAKYSMKGEVPIIYKKNIENGIFNLNILVDIGRDIDPAYGIAVDYIDYLGTSQFNAEALKKEFYKLGCTYSISISADAISLSLSGLDENFVPALNLFESLLKEPVPEEAVLADYIARILKSRQDVKRSKGAIMNGGLVNYAKYGLDSPFRNILSETQLKQLKASDLIAMIKKILSYDHRILYYGPKSNEALISLLNQHHQSSEHLLPVPISKKFTFRDINENMVYWVDFEMVQAEIVMLSKSVLFDKKLVPKVNLYNEYFGGGMGSLVFQEMRESRALAYAVRSVYQNANKKEDPNWNFSYIGTQSDKIIEAIDGMIALLENMPESESLFKNAKENLIETINTQRITKASVLSNYESAKKIGVDYDLRKEIYDWIKTATYSDLKNFQEQYIKDKKRVLLVLGSRDKIDFKTLEKYGKVQQLTKEEIFGY
ncbi:MAG: insulinase family protein [Cytophagales bacterium]|nr:MAG: insulinase family protein [Cytophagales bacterium]